MLTREEFAIMQKQMVDMNDEKLDMIAKIKTYRESNAQIDIIKKAIEENKSLIAKEEEAYNEEISKIQSKVNSYTDQLRLLDDVHQQKTWDGKKLIRLSSSLQNLISTSTAQNSEIETLHKKINEIQNKGNLIIEKINKIEEKNKVNAKILKIFESFGSIQFKISERESQLYILQTDKKNNEKRISNLKLSKSNLAKSNDLLEEKLHNLDNQLSENLNSVNLIEPDLKKSETDLNLLKNNEKDLQLKIKKIVDQRNDQESAFNKIYQEKIDEKVSLQNCIKKLDEIQNQKQQSIDQLCIEKNILVNKKKSLINQLKKSIKDKVSTITKSRSASPQVLSLIDLQENQLVERQQLYEAYRKVEAKHKELTDIVSRKSVILEELKDFMKTVPPLDKNIKISSHPLAMLENAYQVALEENRARADNIDYITQELETVEKENRELKINV